jgi:hypothetical protein
MFNAKEKVMFKKKVWFAASVASVAAMGLPVQAASAASPNLLANAGFEAAAGSPWGDPVDIPGWVDTQGPALATAVAYGAHECLPGRAFPTTAQGATPGGSNFVAGGPSRGLVILLQHVDLSGYAAAIDAGMATVDLSAWLGGYASESDSATVQVDYNDASGKDIGPQTQVGPVSAGERVGTQLVQRTATGFPVPAGARDALVAITFSGVPGEYNDGYADDIVYTLHAPGIDTGNLLVNGDFEDGPGALHGELVTTPGWTDTDTPRSAAVVRYGATECLPGKAFPTLTDPGPDDRGANFAAGGPRNSLRLLITHVDLTPYSAAIDRGRARMDLSGWLGGYADETDNAVVQVDFNDASGRDIGPQAQIGPVTVVERRGRTGLWRRSNNGFPVPGGARDALVAITFRGTGSYNDGYADNLSVKIR